jgi:hypothetical protein
MFEVFREAAGTQTDVFREMDQALEWLAREAP